MNVIDAVFPTIELSATEVTVLVETFKNPVISKYLHLLASNDAKELLSLSTSGRTPEEITLAHENVRGKLATIATLLSLSEVPTPKE